MSKTDDHLPPYADDRSVSLFTGKGGVGKTTLAAATALRRADNDSDDVLLFSTDPAHSLRDLLGEAFDHPALEVVEFDAEARLEQFRSDNREILRGIVEHGTFFEEDEIERLLDLSLPGMDEVMASLELAERWRSGRYDAIVVDTAPTGHTYRLLETPEVFERWLGFLDASLEKHRYMRSVFGPSNEPDRYDRFVRDLDETIGAYRRLLRREAETACYVVAEPEPMSLEEADDLLEHLDRLDVPVGGVIVNRLIDSERDDEAPPVEPVVPMAELAARFEPKPVWGVPLYHREVRGPEALRTVADDLAPLETWAERASDGASDASASVAPASCRVEGSLPVPAADMLMFAGKGGVGKTTMACATAAFAAEHDAVDDVLIASTDPASSLSTCFDREIGPDPVSLRPELSAVDIDADREFEAFRETYREEIESFVTSVQQKQVDPAFDRQVMERLVDVAPPGIDEVMAMVTAADIVRDRDIDLFVVDSAPTGHFLRLLETPEMLGDWLKMFFRIIQSYKRYVRVPKLSSYLVDLSKGLKRVRRTLHDPTAATVRAVATPTSLARAELERMIERLDALEVDVSSLVVNKLLPPNEHPFWRRRLERQWHRLSEMATSDLARGRRMVAVRRGRDVRGLERLVQLGARLHGRRLEQPRPHAS